MNDEHSQEEFLLGIPEPADFNEARLDTPRAVAQQPCTFCSRLVDTAHSVVIDSKVFCTISHYLLHYDCLHQRQHHKIKWFKRK
jgi:hypothetical protein